MVSFSLFRPTSIHSAKCPVIAMTLRDTTIKLQVSKSKYIFFWFQVRATNNIHNQFKSGPSKHTDKYLIYNIIVFTSEGSYGGNMCLNSKFMLTCVLKNVTGSTMHNARFFSLKSAIPFLKVKKYISIFCIYVEMLFI